jgi:hypothetical protein
MRGNRAGAIAEFFRNLSEGDPVALGPVGFFAVLGSGIGLYVLKVRRDLRREDEAWARKHGRRRPTSSAGPDKHSAEPHPRTGHRRR